MCSEGGRTQLQREKKNAAASLCSLKNVATYLGKNVIYEEKRCFSVVKILV
jgi:hypothetical protein